jgi:hypothetical protein
MAVFLSFKDTLFEITKNNFSTTSNQSIVKKNACAKESNYFCAEK